VVYLLCSNHKNIFFFHIDGPCGKAFMLRTGGGTGDAKRKKRGIQFICYLILDVLK